jgi:cation:H+ antiporter
MLPALLALLAGFAGLIFSADRFVDGAAALARHLRMAPLLIGIIVIGFGTSVPEMLVSALAASQGSPGVALGNAYGSNIINIAVVLGLSALLAPVVLRSKPLRRELPILAAVTALAVLLMLDGMLSRVDAAVLLAVFVMVMSYSVIDVLRHREDALGVDMDRELAAHTLSLRASVWWLAVGLVLLLVSSQVLVWGAVTLALHLGVDDLVVGLTVVAIGTSLPELASAVAAARKGEPDLVVGNVVGSNLFNTLVVVGIAGLIQPMQIAPALLHRDLLVMGLFTLSLFVIGFVTHRPGVITRLEGAALLAGYIAYTAWLLMTVT